MDEDKRTPAYKRVLVKISGEALAGDRQFGLDFGIVENVCGAIKLCAAAGVEVGVVVGAGNFWRGPVDGAGKIERTRADHMGMLATAMNALALADVLHHMDVDVRVQTALEIRAVAEPYIRLKADKHLREGRVVVFGCGTGNPYFSTDTAAALRAAELGADAILLAKNVDGVYSADPKTNPDAVRYETLTYETVLQNRLNVMDSTATSLAMDNRIPIVVFALHDPVNIYRAAMGENVGTVVN